MNIATQNIIHRRGKYHVLAWKIKQLNVFEQISELNHLCTKQPTGFLNVLKDNFDLNSFMAKTSVDNYYADLSGNREYELTSVLSSLLIMQIFHIPTTVLFVTFPIFSSEIREFCGFYKTIPDVKLILKKIL